MKSDDRLSAGTVAQLAPWRALDFDVNAVRARPDWLVDGLIARGTVTILSGDTSSAKSFVSLALAMATLQGDQTWLGSRVRGPGRVLVVEGEMPAWEVEDRLRGFGVRNEHWGRLCYLDKAQAVTIDLPEHRERLLRIIETFKPDLVVLDTIFSLTCQTDINAPSDVARFFTETLRPLAQKTSLVALHHENKRGEHGGGAPEQRMTGARQWAAQADRHLILTATDRGNVTSEQLPDGNVRQSYALRLDSGKTRGAEKPSLRLSLDTETDRTGQRLSIDLRVIDGAAGTEAETRIQAVTAAVKGETTTADIARAVGLARTSGTFKRALTAAVDHNLIAKSGRGIYRPRETP